MCFGDDDLSGVPAGTKITVPSAASPTALDAMFWAYVRELDLDLDEVSLALVSDRVGDRALERTSEEVVRNLEAIRRSRRLVALEA